MTQLIYLDNNATTPCYPQVIEAMQPYFGEIYGNPANGLHRQGRLAALAIDVARARVAELIGAQPYELIFTAGATESNNLAILGLARRALGQSRRRIVTTSVEHKAVLEPCKMATLLGYELVVLPVDVSGCVDMEAARKALTSDTLLLSVQAANNEIGTLQPVQELAAMAHAAGALVHCDAAQAVGKIAVDVMEWQIDMLSLSAHKFYGPKGIGALYLRKGPRTIPLEPLAYGGGQERGIRSGTSNVPAIVGLGKAAELIGSTLADDSHRITVLRDQIEEQLQLHIHNSIINGTGSFRLPNTISLTLPGIDVEQLLFNLPDLNLGTGSACSAGAIEPSHVLTAIGLNRQNATSTIRISLGRINTVDECRLAVEQIIKGYQQVMES